MSVARVLASLPRGHALSAEGWQARHRFMQVVLLAHLPLLFTVGVVMGETILHTSAEVGVVAAMAVAAHYARSRLLQAIWVSLGLMSCSGILVHFTGGLIESHFHFFVVLPLVALYQDWRPFLIALGFVLFHHAVVGTIDPAAVYNHPAALASPLRWAVVHATYILALEAVLIFYWRFAEQAEAARRESEHRFNTSFEEAPIGMCMIAADGRFLQVNAAFAEMLGRTVDELRHLGLSDITHPEDLPSAQRAVEEILSGKARRLILEKRYLKAGGDVIWARVGLSVVADRGGAPLYLIAQIEDVTERRQQQEHLEALVRSKDEFIASVSHELRTPLTAVVGSTQLLRDSHDLSEDERAEMVELLAGQSIEVANIVEDLLVVARSDVGAVSVAPRQMPIGETVASVLAGFPDPDRSRVEVEAQGVSAWADPARVRQILRNLVDNAFHYGGPAVRVDVVTAEDRVRIRVVDDGAPIPEERQALIFEAYERAHEEGTKPASVGLGLTVSRRLARMMGGDLTYRWADGRSVFELDLPSSEERPAAVLA